MNKIISQLVTPQQMDDLFETNDEIAQRASQTIRRGRGLVIVGWLVSMLGVVAYCLAMLDSSASIDSTSSLFQRGPMGIIALPLLIVGTACWFIGAYKLLKESDKFGVQDDADKK